MQSDLEVQLPKEVKLIQLIDFGQPDDVVEFVKNENVDVNYNDDWVSTPLLDACYNNLGEKVINALIDAGADVNLANRSGATALSMAIICKNDLSVIRRLIKAGANVNAVTECGSTPLIFAVREKRSQEVITTLIQSGANVNFQLANNLSNFNGFTPLHFAVMLKQQETACFLVENGAKLNILSARSRKSPLDLATNEMRTALQNATKRSLKNKTKSKPSSEKSRSSTFSIFNAIKRRFSDQQIYPKA